MALVIYNLSGVTPLSIPDLPLGAPVATSGSISLIDNHQNRLLVNASQSLRTAINAGNARAERTSPSGDDDPEVTTMLFFDEGNKDFSVGDVTRTWVVPVDSIEFSEPGAPSLGDRHFVFYISDPLDAFTGHNKEIAEWNGTYWVFQTLVAGMLAFIKDTSDPQHPNGFFGVYDGVSPNNLDSFIAHGDIMELSEDQHTQYHNDARGDARYPLIAHTHTEADVTDLEHQLTLPVRNESGGPLTKGTPVYISGWDGVNSLPLVAASRADTAGNMPASGLIFDTSLANNTNGTILRGGTLNNIATDTYATGDMLYVAPTGGLTTTRPVDTNLIQKVSQVIEDHITTGSMIILGTGRINETGNLPENNIWVGNNSGLPTEEPYRGSSFPGSPIDGQRFYHTTDKMEYLYDTTRTSWLSTQMFQWIFSRDGNTNNNNYMRVHIVTSTVVFFPISNNITITDLTLTQTNTLMVGSTLNSSGVILSERSNDLVTFTIDDGDLSVHDSSINIEVNSILNTETGFRVRFTGQDAVNRLKNTVFVINYRIRG